MLKAYKNYVSLKAIGLLLILFALTPIATYNVENIIQGLIGSNYITLILNNLYIIFAFQRVNKINDLQNILIPRITLRQFYVEQMKLGMITICIYSILLYSSCFLFFGLAPEHYEQYVTLFMLTNFVIYVIEELILSLQIGKKESWIYLVLPIAINFYYHYCIIVPQLNGM